MAGGAMKYRQLSRTSAHRQALLRNLVTSLIEHETISTTWPKAKEAQRHAEKLISLGKRDTNAALNRAKSMVYRADEIVPKVFGPLKERYQDRQGGYTRILRIEPLKEDQAPSAILELVDSPKDMKFMMVARTIARARAKGQFLNDITLANVKKVVKYRENGEEELEQMIKKFYQLEMDGDKGIETPHVKKVYPDLPVSR